MCLVAINMLLRWFYTSIMLSIDMQFILDEEKLLFLTYRKISNTIRTIFT